ncbi:MAG TPA: PfkB family carbohydrate kinase [Phycisphaerales bacterium]|nr:PfkB family carbohydrate kinase [Phycisphaerales bacterium]
MSPNTTGWGDGTRGGSGSGGGGLPAGVRAKIVNREQLLAARAEARRAGRALVQCHGCFDIVHPGHIRHLRQARSLGDLLLVSITGDPGISKGVGRPLIPEELRAENLAALDCVDYVYVDDQPTALSLLEAVKPDVYVKGKEYESNNDPRFAAERQAVERAGGRVVFSSGDVVFSSTALIAALEQSADPYHQRLVQLCQREELSGPTLYSLITSFKGKRVAVVGEVILDTYILCDRPEVASESPVMTLRPLEARHYDGGAAVVARHLAALGAKPVLVTVLPATRDGAALRERLEAEGIEVRAMAVKTPVPEKQRFLVGAQKVMKVDLVEPLVLDAGAQERFVEMAVGACGEEPPRSGGVPRAEAAIVTDFGLGLFVPKMMARLCKGLRTRVKTLTGDVSGKRSNLRFMREMDLLCPSEQELREVMRLHGEGLPLVAYRLLEATQSKAAFVTLGADGLIAFSPVEGAETAEGWTTRLNSEHVPALVPIALDPLGCGDSLLSVATLALSAGGSLVQAAFLGACAGAVQVQRLGNMAVTPADLRGVVARVQSSRLVFAGERAVSERVLQRA